MAPTLKLGGRSLQLPSFRERDPRRPKLRKLRIALVIFGLSILAFISWVFGIMMAVASDLPQAEDIAPVVKEATVAIEDQRFYEHRGVDFVGIGRAVVQDVLHTAAQQGAST